MLLQRCYTSDGGCSFLHADFVRIPEFFVIVTNDGGVLQFFSKSYYTITLK